MIKLPPYVTTRKRKGGFRFYFQVPKAGRPDGWSPSIRLKDTPAEMFQEAKSLYARLLAERAGKPLQAYPEGSIPWLLAEYHKSPNYRNLGKGTQYLYGYCAEFISAWSTKAGNPHIKFITRKGVKKFLGQFDSQPTKKKKIYVFLRLLLAFAVDLEVIQINPAVNHQVVEPEAKVHIWTDAEIASFVAKADELHLPQVGTAVLIGVDIGQRQFDILDMESPRDYQDGAFLFTQHKTGEILAIQASQRLRKRLEGVRGRLVPTQSGGRYLRANFTKLFNRVRTAVNLPDCQFLHLRHTAVVQLARSGCTEAEIASITGHTLQSVHAILKRYLPRDKVVADNAIKKREVYRKTLDTRRKPNKKGG